MNINPRPSPSRSPAEMSKAFQRLRQETLAQIRRDDAHQKRIFALQLKERQAQAEHARQLLAQAGLDVKHLDDLEAEEDKRLAEFLQIVRPPLISPPRNFENHLQARTAQATLHQHVGQAATLLGADVCRDHRADGEPTFVWLYDDDNVKDVLDKLKGSGWGCFVKENPDYPNSTATWWYMWTPPEDGLYAFWAIVPYSGFYVIRANDSWYNCKYAKAHAFADLDIHQYFWRESRRRSLVDKRGSNIDATSLASGSVHFNFTEPLNAGDEITVRVTVTLDVYAQGSGSYAELNFSEGEANFLGVPGVFISKVE